MGKLWSVLRRLICCTMRSASKSRVRLSMPIATGRRPLAAPFVIRVESKCSSSESGKLSTTSQPASSSVRSAVDLPAPESPVTSKMRFGAELLFTSGIESELGERYFYLHGSGGLKAAEPNRGHLHAGNRHGARHLRHPLDLNGELHHQADRSLGHVLELKDAEPPYLQLVADILRRRGDEADR